MSAVTIRDTHDRPGIHTVLVAIEVDEHELSRPDLLDDVLAQARDVVSPVLRDRLDQALTGEVGQVLQRHQVDLEQLRARSRAVHLTRARQELCWVLHRGGWSLKRIGRLLDRDHSTVLHAVRQWDQQRREVRYDACEVCGATPMGGGRWCLRHFQEHAEERAVKVARRRTSAAIERERTA